MLASPATVRLTVRVVLSFPKVHPDIVPHRRGFRESRARQRADSFDFIKVMDLLVAAVP